MNASPLLDQPPLPTLQHHRDSILPTLIIAFAIIVGIFLRWFKLGKASLWFDEGYTAWIISLSAGPIIHAIRADTAPPLYYLLMHGWAGIWGRSELALRSLSALSATISLFLFHPLAIRILRDKSAAALAVVLFSVCELQVAYAHEARFYALLALLAQIDLLLVLSAIDKPSKWKYAGLILAWSASLYVNNMMTLYLAALGAAWLILPGLRALPRRLLDLSIVTFATAIIFIPWLPTMLAQSHVLKGNFWVPRPDWHALVRAISALAGVNLQGAGWDSQPMTMAIMATLLLTFIIAGMLLPRTRRQTLALSIFGLGPVLIIFGYSHIAQPIFMERAFIATTVVTPLLITLPLAALHSTKRQRKLKQWLTPVIAIIWLVPGITSTFFNYRGEHCEQWREASAWAATNAIPKTLIVFCANEGELLYDYYQRAGNYAPAPNQLGMPSDFFAIDPPRTMRRVRSDADLTVLNDQLHTNQYLGVILVQSHQTWSDPQRRTLRLLRTTMKQIDERQFKEITVYRFAPDAPNG